MTNNENIQVPKKWIAGLLKKEEKCRGYLFDLPAEVQLLLGYIKSAEAFFPKEEKK